MIFQSGLRIGELCGLKKEDIQDAVNVLETVIDSYQNSTDQENFDISDLTEEQQEQIENSDIAKAIFDLLFK